MEDRVILLGEFNARSAELNLHCDKKGNAADLEALIKQYDLILKNELGVATKPMWRSTTCIIYLTFTTRKKRHWKRG